MLSALTIFDQHLNLYNSAVLAETTTASEFLHKCAQNKITTKLVSRKQHEQFLFNFKHIQNFELFITSILEKSLMFSENFLNMLGFAGELTYIVRF